MITRLGCVRSSVVSVPEKKWRQALWKSPSPGSTRRSTNGQLQSVATVTS
jgi:hypothetical protein